MAGLRGEAVWRALAEAFEKGTPAEEVRTQEGLVIKADADMPAVILTQTITRLAQLGITQVQIGAVPQ